MEFLKRLEMIILERIKDIAISGLSSEAKTNRANCYDDILCHVRQIMTEYRKAKLDNLFKKPTR